MTIAIYCFRDDLRLHDNPALQAACMAADALLPVALLPDDRPGRWGFARSGALRQAFRHDNLRALDAQLQRQGSRLICRQGSMASQLPALLAASGACAVYCEDSALPEEKADIAALRAQGHTVHSCWQGTLWQPDELPWPATQLPDTFTPFRHPLENRRPPQARGTVRVPPLPATTDSLDHRWPAHPARKPDSRSSFPFDRQDCSGGELAAQAHLAQYLARGLPHHYRHTRNQLSGIDFSSKLSPWLACGALSVRTVAAALADFETLHGRSDSSHWLWLELLWREYFRLLPLKYGHRLFWPSGLRGKAAPAHDADAFARWMAGNCGQPLVDAGMRELAATGYLSNRMRQIVASYLIHDLHGDWRAGAAWFEASLIDYDASLNHGNWLYIAGLGTDPRGGRHFNPDKQTAEHDADGHYRQLWSTP